MKSRPILFSTPMVQAILEGRKTQTRRIVKPQPPLENIDEDPCFDYDRGVEKGSMENPVLYAEWAQWQDEFVNTTTKPIESHCVYSPYGKHGDVLWVRETFFKNPNTGVFVFKAATEMRIIDTDFVKWKPSIFMPKDAARIWLKITDVRVQRLQDIDSGDAISEGIEFWWSDLFSEYRYKDYANVKDNWRSSVSSFQSLWSSIHGINSWDDNPWVWVIEFERIEKPSEV
jgi:hypothetical protein